MNLLLTGGTGYIGSHTAVVLAQAAHRVVLLDDLSNSRAEVVDRLERLIGERPAFVHGDLRDSANVAAVLRDQRIDGVVHFAGRKAVAESVAHPIDYYSNNVVGTVSLLRAMEETGVRVLVFSSSATVYGEPRYLPIDEAHPTTSINPYGRCKLHIEEMLADVAMSDPSWRIVVLRYFNPVGAHETALIGEEPVGTPSNLMPILAEVAAGRRAAVEVFGDDYPTPDGTGVRDYIHVMDLAEGHREALRYAGAQAGWQVFNLGTGRGFSVREMVEAYARCSGRELPVRIAARRSGDVAACYAKVERAAQLLRWQAHRDLDAMCASSWRWTCARGSDRYHPVRTSAGL